MKLTNQVKPVSHLKAHAAEIIDDLAAGGPPLIITRRGEAKAVLMDVASYEATQETLAMLEIVALGRKSFSEGRYSSASQAMARIRKRLGA